MPPKLSYSHRGYARVLRRERVNYSTDQVALPRIKNKLSCVSKLKVIINVHSSHTGARFRRDGSFTRYEEPQQ
jgi:hypothetical protein